MPQISLQIFHQIAIAFTVFISGSIVASLHKVGQLLYAPNLSTDFPPDSHCIYCVHIRFNCS